MDPRLRTAALRGDLAALTRALDEGADPCLADEDGYTPLHYAAYGGMKVGWWMQQVGTCYRR